MQKLRIIPLQPTLSHDEAEKQFKGRYLTRADYTQRPTGSVRGVLPDGSTAFIFLRGLFPKDEARTLYEEVLSKLKFSDARHSRRPGLKGGKGGEMLMGWVNFPFPRPAGPVKHQFELYLQLFKLMSVMKDAVKEHLPQYYEQQLKIIAKQPEMHPWLDLFEQDAAFFKMVEDLWKQPDMRDQKIPLFSTLTINKSTLFRSHADAKNQGGLACLAAFGTFSGGDFCLPRLRVAFPLSPGDLLIADNNNEQHGNIGPLAGNRISVVAYLRTMQREYDIPFWYPDKDGSAGPLQLTKQAAAAMGATASAPVKVEPAPTFQIQAKPVEAAAPSKPTTPRRRLVINEDEDVK
jgi:hypothetical protein